MRPIFILRCGFLSLRPVKHAQDLVERIALGGNAPGAPDELDDVVESHRLCRGRASFVIDLLANDGSLEIVDAERKRRLRKERGHHDPVRLDVLEVVEVETADGEIPEIVESARRSSLPAKLSAQIVVVRVERKG